MKRPRRLLSGLGPAPAPPPHGDTATPPFVRQRMIIQANIQGVTAEWVFEMGYSQEQQSYYIDRLDSPAPSVGVELQAPKVHYGSRADIERGWDIIKQQFEWPRYYYAVFHGDNPNPVETNDPDEIVSGAPVPTDDYMPVQFGGLCPCGWSPTECERLNCEHKP